MVSIAGARTDALRRPAGPGGPGARRRGPGHRPSGRRGGLQQRPAYRGGTQPICCDARASSRPWWYRSLARATPRACSMLPIAAPRSSAGRTKTLSITLRRRRRSRSKTPGSMRKSRSTPRTSRTRSRCARASCRKSTAGWKRRRGTSPSSWPTCRHELRTPLNAIIGFTRLVMRRSKDVLPAKQYENLEKILAQRRASAALINDVLDLSKIEAGRWRCARSSFAARAADRPVPAHGRADGQARSRCIWSRRSSPDLPTLFTDQDKLTPDPDQPAEQRDQVHRGRHASPCGARRTAIGSRSRSRTPASASRRTRCELIFEEFRQVDSSSTRQHGGTGLGPVHQPALRAPAGRRHHGAEHAREGLDVHAHHPLRYEARAASRLQRSPSRGAQAGRGRAATARSCWRSTTTPTRSTSCARTSAMPATGWSARSAARRACERRGRYARSRSRSTS